jgi:hypothetical protein
MASCQYKCKSGKIFMEALGFVDCPDCRNITKVLETPKEEGGASIFDKLRIPPSYKSLGTAGHELFNGQGLGTFSASSLNEVGNLFERINKDLYSSRVPNISCYIYTTNLVDTKRFIYGAQKLALEKSLGVTPLISANTLYGLQKAGDYSIGSMQDINMRQGKKGELANVSPDMIHAVEGYRFIQFTELSYFDFIHADVCFIEATANTIEKGWTGLADLLGERAKQGLPTFVFGYWGAKSGSWTGSKGLKYLLAPDQGSVRLDLLVPFELKSKKGDGADEAQVQRMIDVDNSKSSVSAGLSIASLMRT